MNGLRLNKNGQVTLEMACVLVLVFILLIGALKVFIWLNQTMVGRQQLYESQRVAQTYPPDAQGNFQDTPPEDYAPPPLDIFSSN